MTINPLCPNVNRQASILAMIRGFVGIGGALFNKTTQTQKKLFVIISVIFYPIAMPKAQLKAWLPKPEELKKHKVVRVFAPFLADPRLWHLNRGSLVRAVYIGVMCAFFPLPGQMPLAVMGALIFRANVPMSIALTWITNPLTAIPVYWVAYCVGALLLGEPIIGLRTIGLMVTEMTLWLFGDGINPFTHNSVFSIKTFGVGLVATGIATSIILGQLFKFFWRYKVTKDWKKRDGYRPHSPKFSDHKNKHSKNKHSKHKKG